MQTARHQQKNLEQSKASLAGLRDSADSNQLRLKVNIE
jgi:hypothetical protein